MNLALSVEIRRKVNAYSKSISYEGILAHVCQNRPFSCAKSCDILRTTAKRLTNWGSICYVGSVPCAKNFGTRGLSLAARVWFPEYKCFRDVFRNFCRVKREIHFYRQWLKTHRFDRVGISIANDRTEPVFIGPSLLTRSGLFRPAIICLPRYRKGEYAPYGCLFCSGQVTSPFTPQSCDTRTSRQGPLRSPPCLADVL